MRTLLTAYDHLVQAFSLFSTILKYLDGISIAFFTTMATKSVKTCFTITFSSEQYDRARQFVDDMKTHPNRVFWRGKDGKTDEELIIEQIAHRILSGFYNDDPFNAGKHIIRMDNTPQERM